jgi:hypothetical protein
MIGQLQGRPLGVVSPRGSHGQRFGLSGNGPEDALALGGEHLAVFAISRGSAAI